jgi:hypothetical protein
MQQRPGTYLLQQPERLHIPSYRSFFFTFKASNAFLLAATTYTCLPHASAAIPCHTYVLTLRYVTGITPAVSVAVRGFAGSCLGF